MAMEKPHIKPSAGVMIGMPRRASSASRPTSNDKDTMGATPISANRMIPSRLATANNRLYSGA